MANTRVAKLRFLRRDSGSTTSDSDIKLQQGQPFIDMTADPKENPGTLYVGQGEGSLDESGVNVKHSEEAGKFDHEISMAVNLAANETAVFWDGSESVVVPGVGGILPVANGGTGSAKFDVGNVGEGVLATTYGGTGRSDGTVAQADTASKLSTITRLITDLESENYAAFNGEGGQNWLGVTGVLPTSHGGTGSSSTVFSYGSSKTTASTRYCRKWDASSSGSVVYPFITEHGDVFYVGATCNYYSIGNLWVGAIVYGDQTEDLDTQYQGLHQNWSLKINLKGWLGDIISNVSIKSVSVIARGTDTTNLNGYQCGGGYCTYIDDTDKVIYIGQSFNASPTGIYITVMGTIEEET